MSEFLTETEDKDIEAGTPQNATQAELVIGALTFTSRAYGKRANRISVAYVVDGPDAALSVETSGNAIVVHLATDPYGASTSTSQDVADELGAYHPLVTVEAGVYAAGEVAVATPATRLTGAVPSGPRAVKGTLLMDAYSRYVALEDALSRSDPAFTAKWQAFAL